MHHPKFATPIGGSFLLLLLVAQLTNAQPPIGEQFGGIAELLRRSDVLEELDVSTDQAALISTELHVLSRTAIAPAMIVRQVAELPDGERAAGYKKLVEENNARVRVHYDRIMESLTAAQRERLGQLVLQSRIERYGIYAVFGIGPLASELDLESTQRGQLNELGKVSKAELEWQIQWLRHEATTKTLKEVLNDEQFNRAQRRLGLPLKPPKERRAHVATAD